MSDFRTIDIDFDVHKVIEAERASFSETPNDVLRRLLGLGERVPPVTAGVGPGGGRSWSGDGVTLPHGTRVRMRYNGRLYEGQIVDGRWVVEGKSFPSPSGAASGVAITKKGRTTRLDGWVYWEAQLPGEPGWTRIAALRNAAMPAIDVSDLDLNL